MKKAQDQVLLHPLRLASSKQGHLSLNSFLEEEYILQTDFKTNIMIVIWASQVVPWVRIHLPMQETWVQSLGWEDSPGGGNGNTLQYSFCLVLSLFLN